MHPAQPIGTPPPHLQQHNLQRSWSDENVTVNNGTRDPIRPAPRSSSFAASRVPQPQWNNHPPPPPVPPLPPSLLRGYYSPPLSHTNIDFTFAEPARGPLPAPKPWLEYNDPNSSHISLPPLPRAATDPSPSGTRIDQRDHFDSNSSLGPPRPVVPPRPVTSYVTATPVVESFDDRRLPFYGGFKNIARSPSPLPAVPPRPPTAHGEVTFKSSLTMSSQTPSSVPPVPPKPALLPNGEHTLTPSGQDNAVSGSSNPQPIAEILATGSPLPKAQASETLSLDSDLQHALTLSLADSHRNHEALEEEDDELARALAESLSFAAALHQDTGQLQTDASRCSELPQLPVKPENLQQQQGYFSGVTPSSSSRRASVPDCGRDILSPAELEDHAAHGQIMQESKDEEVTRRLQEEEERRLAAGLRERERQDEERERMDAELIKQLQEQEARRSETEKKERERHDQQRVRMDAEFAWREAAEEKAQRTIREAQERRDAAIARRMAETNDDGRTRPPKGIPLAPDPALVPGAPGLPLYNDIMSSLSTQGAPTRLTLRTMQSSPQLYNDSVQHTRPGRAASAFVSGSVRTPEQGGHVRSVMVNTHNAGLGNDIGLSAEGLLPRSRAPSPVDGYNAGRNETPSITSSREGVAPLDNAIEPDLMKGVSYGFIPPDTRSPPAQPLSVCPPFPEVISLSRAPCPPFHIMATSWRHLMRLLAQLETRIEANLETIAGSKEDNLLRVVVQFVKLPYSANTWGTIVHLTIDQPVPSNAQNAWRSTNKDTAMLPYSYTLSQPMPYLANHANSRLYVIPLSPTSPFPILPISLPNLALYLQSAMRDSRVRKVQNDPSNGMRRLAKMVMECYPEEVVNPDREERKPSRGVGNLFKRVVGRGGDREDSGSQRNEDVYDFITPFRIDQYTSS